MIVNTIVIPNIELAHPMIFAKVAIAPLPNVNIGAALRKVFILLCFFESEVIFHDIHPIHFLNVLSNTQK